MPIADEVWQAARLHWELCQTPDGGWGYRRGDRQSTASMTTAGISSLIIAGSRLSRGTEVLDGPAIRQCGQEEVDIPLRRGVDWLATNFSVRMNVGGRGNKLYYLYGLERAGRLAGLRYFGVHDWYREGAEELIRMQNPVTRRLDRYARPGGLHLLRAAVPGQGACAGAGQQASARPARRLEQRCRRYSQPRRRRLARLEAPADLAGGRPRGCDHRGPAPGSRSPTSTATRAPCSTIGAGRTSATSSSRGASSWPRPAAAGPNSTSDSAC